MRQKAKAGTERTEDSERAVACTNAVCDASASTRVAAAQPAHVSTLTMPSSSALAYVSAVVDAVAITVMDACAAPASVQSMLVDVTASANADAIACAVSAMGSSASAPSQMETPMSTPVDTWQVASERCTQGWNTGMGVKRRAIAQWR